MLQCSCTMTMNGIPKLNQLISYSFYFLRHARAAAWLAPGQGSGAVAAAAHLVAAGGWSPVVVTHRSAMSPARGRGHSRHPHKSVTLYTSVHDISSVNTTSSRYSAV